MARRSPQPAKRDRKAAIRAEEHSDVSRVDDDTAVLIQLDRDLGVEIGGATNESSATPTPSIVARGHDGQGPWPGSDAAQASDQTRDERLVKSAARVRDLGEVFTPAATVYEMLDLLPVEVWLPHPSATFLEPACGDGNFLVAILERKLARISHQYGRGTLVAGSTPDALRYHALQAVASIYAVDISMDNIIGGTPGHEIGARSRILAQLAQWHDRTLGEERTGESALMMSAHWIIERNLQIGNMLPATSAGFASGRDDLPVLTYDWDPASLRVVVKRTTLGAVMAAAEVDAKGVGSLFGPPDPKPVWSGPAIRLHEARSPVPVCTGAPARNGNGRDNR